ncbi:hypothetical protein [Burkholderia cepacia]|uniref:hypothetical protein n=1 Tax=Burkholderia cepacia TaxID=292 RepID=UPI001CF371AC|nr:hypothetical protein [Burkholderia cepacia]MCA8320078.1 hypothetical protein [Burkholderia cepacia]
MAELQKANLGVPPSGAGGDDQRAANTRFNSNVDILKTQAALASAGPSITAPRTLTVDEHVGRRVGINLANAGTVKLPSAKKCAADQVILLRNFGTTVVTLAVEDGSGDYIGLDRLQPFETVLMDTNGSTGWWVLYRGRASSGDETVVGNLTVGGKVSAVHAANLLANSTGELRNQCWSGTNFGWLNGSIGEGTMFINSASIDRPTGYAMDYSDNVPVASGVSLTLSAEIATGGLNSGQVYMKVESFNPSGTLLGTFAFAPITTKRDYTFVTVSGKTPSGTSHVRVSRVADNAPNIAQWGVAFRRIKLERGSSPSLYSQEASALYLQGAPGFDGRPTFGGNVPWDSGNLPRPLQHSDIGAIAAAGGETRDLSINFEPRLALNFTPKASSVFATASLYINIGQHPAVANDFIAYLTVFDVAANAQVAGGAPSIISVPNGSLYVGLSSAGSLTCSVAHGSLVIGKQYQVLLYVRKVQPVGPVYPAGMSINGVVV